MPDGPLPGHAEGWGTWENAPGSHDFQVSGDRLLLLNPSAAPYNQVGDVAAIGPIAPYTKDADWYLDIVLDSLGASTAMSLYFELLVGLYSSVTFGLEYVVDAGLVQTWTLFAWDTELVFSGSNPPGMAAGTSFRLGAVHDVVAGTVQFYSEPYGGGARTNVGAPQPVLSSIVGLTQPELQLGGTFDTPFGYATNVTLITEDIPPTTDPAQSTATIPDTGTTGVPVPITVVTRTSDGTPRTSGGDTVTVTVAGANPVVVVLTDNGDGTYSGSYTPSNPGPDTITVTDDPFGGGNPQPISGSPYRVGVVGPWQLVPPPAGSWS